MTSNEFVNWLKGYIDGIENVSPKCFDINIKNKIKEVADIPSYPYYYNSNATSTNDTVITTNNKKTLLNG
jgi:hypothetical protein